MPRSLRLSLAGVLGLLILAAPAQAAAPPNDASSGALALGLGSGAAIAQSTLGATSGLEPGTSTAAGGCARMGKTVWFKLQGNGHNITVATAGSAIDTVLAIYDGSIQKACSDDVSTADNKSRATVGTLRGNTYLVQVGGQIADSCNLSVLDNCAPFGSITVTASGSPRPADDDRASAQALGTGVPATVDTTGATTEPGERLTCGAAPYAATVWFAWTAPATGTPTIDASAVFTGTARPADTVLTVYRASDGAELGCNDDASAPAGASRVTLGAPVAAGEVLLIQAGPHGTDGLGLGEGPLTVQVSEPPPPVVVTGNPDADHDGVSPPTDCRDDRPDIHPGAVDIPQDGIDQNCDGRDAPFPLLSTTIVGFSDTFPGRGFSRFTDLRLRHARQGAVVQVSCHGAGCPSRKPVRRRLRASRGSLSILGRLGRARLRTGAVVQVRVTAPRAVGRVATWRIRAPKAPKRTDACLAPNAKKPGRCPG